MKKIFTLCAMMVAFIAGTTLANAQSKIPGTLDLSTTTIEQGDGPALHASAGWNGTNIDWMQTGQKAIIQFENTVATSYNIVYRAGTPNADVTITFDITDASGAKVYSGTSNVKVGGWGDKTQNSDLPATNELPVGNYTLTLTFNNPNATTTANVYEIEFVDVNAKPDDPQPSTTKGLNIPGVLDGQQAVITKNCSWGSTPSCDDDNCFNWVGDGDVVTFAITNTQASAYAISFDTATPCEPVTIDFLITDASGNTVYGQTASVVCTGENGGDWAFKPEGHNTSLPNTDVLPAGNYTLQLTFHQGTNYENFTTNLKDITFEAVGGAAAGNDITIDMSTFGFVTNANNTGNWNGEKLDYFQFGDVISIPFVVTEAGNYNVQVDYATIMSGLQSTYSILTAGGQQVWSEVLNLPYTTPNEGNNDWGYVKTVNATTDATLPAGNYNLQIAYDHRGLWEGSDGLGFQYNIHGLKLIAKGGAPSTGAKSVFLHGENFDKANSTNDLYQFTGADGFTLTMNNRDIARTPCNWTDPNGVAYTDGINFKNNDPGTINIPEGFKVTKLEIGGLSQSDAGNLCYLYTVDKDGVNFFTDGIGQDVKENSTIQSTAKYVIQPDGNAPLFATLDFSAAPATKSITVVFSGNNQEDVWFKVYYTTGDDQPVASKTIYSWVGGENGATEVGGTAVATDGESVNYANAGNWTIRINKKKADIETENVTITLDEALAEGDEIAITGYRNKDTDANGTLYMLFENGAVIDEGEDEIVWNNLALDQQPNTRTFTVGAEAGSKTIKIARSKASTNVFITEIKITRGGSAEQPLNIRVWDFTKWSDATVANLKADAAASALTGWSDVEKQADAEAGNGPTDISKDNAFWFQGEIPADGQLTANGVVIEETKGLIFQSAIGPRRNLAIAVNYPETSLGAYAGGSYLWLGGSGLDYFEIPDVKAGESIYMELESHKPTDARGVKVSQNGTEIDTFTPTTKDSRMWTIPADGNVLISNTNGCHIYVIKVGAEADLNTGIKAIENVVAERPANNYICNLRGQRVDASYKGIVIMNGKKFFQK